MKISVAKYIPAVMATVTVLIFVVFLMQDSPSMQRGHQSNIRKSLQHYSNIIAPQENSANREPILSNEVVTGGDSLTRPSLTPGIRWPKLTRITPSYSSSDAHISASSIEALSYAANAGDVVGQYPAYISLLKSVETWNPDDPDAPLQFIETLQHFNYSDPVERILARKFRDAEVPFKLYDVPEVDNVVDRWTDEYLEMKFRTHNHIVEVSEHNHFMFWKDKDTSRSYPEWSPPTEHIDMPFPAWLKIAKNADLTKQKNDTTHHYFITNSNIGDRKTFVAKDLNFFATDSPNFFITNVAANKGIQCRFGMRGIIAATHYDGGKNMVAMLKGRKRYILNPPNTCKYLAIIPDKKHPSYRHSIIDWSNLDECKKANFDRVAAIDTIVNTGEVLYIPSYWFHYPISMDYSIQCNSRSGSPPRGEGKADIEECQGEPFNDNRLKRYNGEIQAKKKKRPRSH